MFKNLMGKKDAPNKGDISQKTISELIKSTKFSQQHIEELYELFMNISDSNGFLDKAHLQERLGLSLARKTHFVDRLYEGFKGKDNKITFQNYVITLNLIQHGDLEEKSKFCFRLWDADNSDSVSRAEVRSMVESTIDCGLALAELVLQSLPPRAPAHAKRLELDVKVQPAGRAVRLDLKPADVRSPALKGIAAAAPDEAGLTRLADAVFDAADANRDGKISRSEFKAYVTREQSPLKLLDFYAQLLSTQIDPGTLLLRS